LPSEVDGRIVSEIYFWMKIEYEDLPCTRLARGKFELINQDSGGGKNSSVLM